MVKFHRELARRLHEEGVTVTEIEHRSKTIAFHCAMGGHKVVYYTSMTPSDLRALDNALKDIVRDLKRKANP